MTHIKDIHERFIKMDLRVYMVMSVMVMFLIQLPFNSADDSLLTVSSGIQSISEGGSLLPLSIWLFTFEFFFTIWIFIGLPIVIFNKLFNRVVEPLKVILVVGFSVLLVTVGLNLLVGDPMSPYDFFLSAFFSMVSYYTYYLFRMRGDLSPALAVFSQVIIILLLQGVTILI